jgi:hypothetical protein
VPDAKRAVVASTHSTTTGLGGRGACGRERVHDGAMSRRSFIAASCVGVLSAACAQPAADAGGTARAAVPVGLEGAVQAARADAARRTGQPAAAFELISAESVTWSDGSLGCPQPDVLYTQALVPGYRIVLRGPSEEMDYHASARGALVLCPAGRAVEPLPGASRM